MLLSGLTPRQIIIVGASPINTHTHTHTKQLLFVADGVALVVDGQDDDVVDDGGVLSATSTASADGRTLSRFFADNGPPPQPGEDLHAGGAPGGGGDGRASGGTTGSSGGGNASGGVRVLRVLEKGTSFGEEALLEVHHIFGVMWRILISWLCTHHLCATEEALLEVRRVVAMRATRRVRIPLLFLRFTARERWRAGRGVASAPLRRAEGWRKAKEPTSSTPTSLVPPSRRPPATRRCCCATAPRLRCCRGRRGGASSTWASRWR